MEGMRNTKERRTIMKTDKTNTSEYFADYPDVLNVEQLSAILGISTKTAYKLLKEGQIQSIHIGKNYKIPKVHLLKYLKILP